jgi:hypothetical protein
LKKPPPAWIEVLFKRHGAGHSLMTGFLLNLEQAQIAREAAAFPNGAEDLRRISLQKLGSGREETVALALVFLSAVGRGEDASRVEGFVESGSDLIRRAARACRFQLKARR